MAQATISTTVTGLQGHPVSNVAPLTNQALAWNGTQWAPSSQFAQLSGGTLTGPLILAADATTPLQATTLEQMQAADTQVLNTASDNIGRNYLHNSMFNVQQRGQGPWTTSGIFTADRWGIASANDTVSVTLFPMADTDRAAIGDESAINGWQNVFTGSTTAGSFSAITENIESVRRLSGKTIIASFWARASSGNPRLGGRFTQVFGSGGSPSATTSTTLGATAALTTAWTRYSFSVAVPSAAGKTFGTTAGTDFSGFQLFFSDQGNLSGAGIGVQSGTVQLWGLQLEVAQGGQTQPTPLEKPDPRYDIANCLRFYQVVQVLLICLASGGNFNGSLANVYFDLMRTTPTTTANSTGGSGSFGAVIGAIGFNTLQAWLNGSPANGNYQSFNLLLSADI
jgi:hypothetical protein